MKKLKDAIISQNITIDDFVSNNDSVFECKYFIRSKNQNFQHLIIEISPELRKIFLSLEKVNIFWSRHYVKDFISITRCFKCLGFSHSRDKCDSQIFCSECGKEGHDYKSCKSDSGHKTCINCVRYNQKLNTNQTPVDTKHDAFYGSCPTLNRMKNLIMSKINYE